MKQGERGSELLHIIIPDLFEGVAAVEASNPWVIPNVKILGYVSKNGNRYTEACLDKAVADGVYEGCSFGLNHVVSDSRDVRDLPGHFERVKHVRGDGLRGDMVLTTHDAFTESLHRVAVANPKKFGLSHHIPPNSCKSHVAPDGTVIVEEIYKVASVDLVKDPATTNGLFEGVQPVTPTVTTPAKIKFRNRILPAVTMPAEKLRFERILESMGGAADMEVVPGNVPVIGGDNKEGDATTPSPEDTIKDSFRGMMTSLVEGYIADGDDTKLVSGIKNAAKACGLMLKGGEPKKEADAAEGDDKGKSEPPVAEDKGDKKEAVIPVLGPKGAAAILEARKIPITAGLLESVGSQTEAQASPLLESLAASQAKIADLEKRLNIIAPEQQTRSVARATGAMLEAVGGGDGGEKKPYVPQFLPSIN